ncbi:centriolar coiled-coil protein of 110 kDa-like isoform X2 [Scleropages formosus]|uniref:centriolar coiled-coil protein of 110 kDa-like isoform X2 n=1 Tax=Scleropages formosus TaxID=113540 RepID=UPI0010FABC94|nr:centriolar coiled-coil protein of 110 kDa-like isoform X2 [Scleropages formosus]
MESYEEFCSRSLARVLAQGEATCRGASGQKEAPHSLIQFHGMAVLAPLLSGEQRGDMVRYRQRAVRLEADRRNRHRDLLLARVRDILDRVQVLKSSQDSETLAPPTGSLQKHQSVTGFSLLPDTSTPPCGERGGGDSEEDDNLEREARTSPRSGDRCGDTPVLEESLSDKENESGGPGDESCGGGAGAHPTPSPAPLSPARRQPDSDPSGPLDLLLGCLPHSLTGSYAQLPNPKPSLSPLPHRRRLRPLSTGNILISDPMNAAELSPPRSRERALLGSPPPSPAGGSVLDGPSCGSPPSGKVSPRVASPRDFRRRSQTLDSPLYPGVDRSQERVPRFLVEQHWRPLARRSPPAPLNKSYDVERPSPALLRPHVAADPSPTDTRPGRGSEGSRQGRRALGPRDGAAGEAQVLEDIRQQPQEENSHRFSAVRAEQERAQPPLQERKWREQGDELVLAKGPGRDSEALSENCSPLTPILQADKLPGPSALSKGYSPAVSSHVPSVTVRSPVYPWGPSPGASRTRSRLTLAVLPEQQRALCRLTALARGFLTRRLLSTEKVKHLRQTVQDTQEFIRSFQNEVPGKRAALSAQDLSLQERVRAQLRAALFDIHDIFFAWGVGERMALLQQDRELRAERKLREMEKARSPRERVTLSAATQKSLHRKKQRMIEMSGQGKRASPKTKIQAKNSCGPHKRLSAPLAPTVSPRILQPSQGQNALPMRPLLRQGSLYKKSPEERVKRCHNLRKQHSLG